MKWMRERDLLIAQTLAFVQSVSGKKPGTEAESAPPSGQAASVEAIRAALEIVDLPATPTGGMAITRVDVAKAETSPAQASAQAPQTFAARPMPQGDYKSEIKSRVANFRAHQERFNREREAYGNAVFAKARASIDDTPAPPRK